jgi:hypothetical protein
MSPKCQSRGRLSRRLRGRLMWRALVVGDRIVDRGVWVAPMSQNGSPLFLCHVCSSIQTHLHQLHPRTRTNVSLCAIFEIIMAYFDQNFRDAHICRLLATYRNSSNSMLTPIHSLVPAGARDVGCYNTVVNAPIRQRESVSTSFPRSSHLNNRFQQLSSNC